MSAPKPIIDTPTKRIVFEYPADGDVPPFRDAVEVPLDATSASINAQIDARYAAYVEAVRNPPAPDPVPEQTAVELARETVAASMQALGDAMQALDAVGE